MAFMKYADARIIHPNVTRTQWHNIRAASGSVRAKVAKGGLNPNLVERAAELFDTTFDPSQYLLSHATIISSVDTFSPPGEEKVGSVLVDGFNVHRKFGDYRITSGTSKYINNNEDAWSRPVLLKSYSTFIGGQNFCEHVQIEELSKGRIIDAAARDVGESIYVDILIATEKKHEDLITAIRNGKMGTLSMGCSIEGSICTKCGHWAADETELCNHIKYAKGNTFFDKNGRIHRIAELCGHESIDPHGGVQFVEASWVETPAFTGAVLRNVLEPTEELNAKAAKVLATPPPQWSEEDMLKAAHFVASEEGVIARDKNFVLGRLQDYPLVDLDDPSNQDLYPKAAGDGRDHAEKLEEKKVSSLLKAAELDFLAGWMDEGGGGEGEGDEEEEKPAEDGEKSPLEEAEDKIEQFMVDRVRTKILDKLKGDASPALNQSSDAPNDSLVKQGSRAQREASTINSYVSSKKKAGIEIPVRLARAVLDIGRYDQFDSELVFKKACLEVLGKKSLYKYELDTIRTMSQLMGRKSTSKG